MQRCGFAAASTPKLFLFLLDLGKKIITLHIVTGLGKDALDGAANRSKYCRFHFHSGELEKCLTFLNLLTHFDVAIDQDTGHRAADGPLVGRVALLPPNLAGTSGTSHEFRGEGIGSSNEPLLSVDLESDSTRAYVFIVVVDVSKADVEVLARSDIEENLFTGLERTNKDICWEFINSAVLFLPCHPSLEDVWIKRMGKHILEADPCLAIGLLERHLGSIKVVGGELGSWTASEMRSAIGK
mmetsp:Transcript_28445/g.66758  ORF Transcript_28445/g.66758 Transcript_28445/m.66758 type:complete len:241 (-) Transcript_28445:3080-3802(-)